MKSSSLAVQLDPPVDEPDAFKIRWLMNVPFWAVHIVAIAGVIVMGWSWSGFALAVALYYLRLFGITAGYHRYFSHRSFKTSRPMQFVFALLGVITTQKGPLWWAAHHRRHHKYSDMPEDVHSVRQRGFIWSHFGWILVGRHYDTEWHRIKDLAKYPELRFLNSFHMLFDIAFAVSLYLIGGAHALIWGYFVSTVMAWHGTFTINSLAHVWGSRRYKTSDDSRNNFFLALLTLGEGWHTN
ncbi:MAG: fatty acid desaturase, partial [Myxococcota bacterium]